LGFSPWWELRLRAAVPVYDSVLHTSKYKPEDGDNRLPQKLFVAVYDVRRLYC